jgi:hypothetical protein
MQSRSNIDGVHPGAEQGKLPRIRAFAAPDIEPVQPVDRRQHRQEGRRIQRVPINVVPGTGMSRPSLRVGFPMRGNLSRIHGGTLSR